MAPSNTVEITDRRHSQVLLKCIDALENHDDVESVTPTLKWIKIGWPNFSSEIWAKDLRLF